VFNNKIINNRARLVLFILLISVILISFSIISFSFGFNSNSNLQSSVELKVTSEHPFLINNSWIPAKDLKVGDELRTIDGNVVEIESIEFVPDEVQVYNLEDKLYHNYVASSDGSLGVVVHNSDLVNHIKSKEVTYTHFAEGNTVSRPSPILMAEDLNTLTISELEQIIKTGPDLDNGLVGLKALYAEIKKLDGSIIVKKAIWGGKNSDPHHFQLYVSWLEEAGLLSLEERNSLGSAKNAIEWNLRFDKILKDRPNLAKNVEGYQIQYNPSNGKFVGNMDSGPLSYQGEYNVPVDSGFIIRGLEWIDGINENLAFDMGRFWRNELPVLNTNSRAVTSWINNRIFPFCSTTASH